MKRSGTLAGLSIFLFLSLAIGLLVFLVTYESRTYGALRELNVISLLLALAVTSLMFVLDAIRLMVMARALECRLPFWYALKSMAIFFFLSAVTPTATGGEPALLYLLKKKGLSIGHGTALTLVKLFLTVSLLAVTGPVIIYFHREMMATMAIRLLFDYVTAFFILSVGAGLLVFFKPSLLSSASRAIMRLASRLGMSRTTGPALAEKASRAAADFSWALQLFFRRKTYLFYTVLLTILWFATQFMILPIILDGFGFHLPIVRAFMVQTVIGFFSYFVPTPGASGAVEGGFFVLFKPFIPVYLLGVSLILWRFFTVYLGVVVGGILAFRMVGRAALDKGLPEARMGEDA